MLKATAAAVRSRQIGRAGALPPTRQSKHLSNCRGASHPECRSITRQFRRTLAWHIANRPFGTIAGMIQYKHASVAAFEGYAGSSHSGFLRQVEQEHRYGQLDDILEYLDANEIGDTFGGQVSRHPLEDHPRRRLPTTGPPSGAYIRSRAFADDAVRSGADVACRHLRRLLLRSCGRCLFKDCNRSNQTSVLALSAKQMSERLYPHASLTSVAKG